MDKPEVGQTLYSLNIGNAARYSKQKLTPVIVTKVGRKYFLCKQGDHRFKTQYRLDNWYEKTDYTANSKLYLNPQHWEDEREATDICKLIYKTFEYGRNREGVSLGVLREIKRLIEVAIK